MTFKNWISDRGFELPLLPNEEEWLQEAHKYHQMLMTAKAMNDEEQIARFTREYERVIKNRLAKLVIATQELGYSPTALVEPLLVYKEIQKYHAQVSLHQQAQQYIHRRQKYGWEIQLLSYPLREDIIPCLKEEIAIQHKWHKRVKFISRVWKIMKKENINRPKPPYGATEITHFIQRSKPVVDQFIKRRNLHFALIFGAVMLISFIFDVLFE